MIQGFIDAVCMLKSRVKTGLYLLLPVGPLSKSAHLHPQSLPTRALKWVRLTSRACTNVMGWAGLAEPFSQFLVGLPGYFGGYVCAQRHDSRGQNAGVIGVANYRSDVGNGVDG